MSRRILLSGLMLSGLGLSALLLPAVAGSASREKAIVPADAPSDRYYAVFLSHQSGDNLIEMSHTFAAFFRTTGVGPQQRVLEQAVISWFPKSAIVGLGRPTEPGVNKSLADTLSWAEERGLEVTVDGVYEIRSDLFRSAQEQAARLDRGELRYKTFDRFTRKSALNCFHAVADIAADPKMLNSGGARGRDATLLTIRHLQSHFVSENLANEATPLLAQMKLQRYVQPAAELASAH